MTLADEARENSISCEMVKYAYRQTKDGVVVSFVVHPNDVPPALSTAHIGARYVAVLVQIGDDELPINQPARGIKTFTASTPARPDPTDDKPDRAKRDWRDVQPSAQAAMLGEKPEFWAFLREEKRQRVANSDDAATAVRKICGVNSRAHFNTNHAARVCWHQLDTEYQAWQARERVGV